MRKIVLGLAFAVALSGGGAPLFGQSDAPAEKTPEALALEGIDRLMRALELMLQAIPQYEAPFIDENGDIIIRRKHPEDDRPETPIPQQKPAPPGSIPT